MEQSGQANVGRAGRHAFGVRPMPATTSQLAHGEGNGIGNEPDQHAFVMLGTSTLMLCHLTMFHMEEHMYQFVVEARLPDDAMEHYRKLRQSKPLDTFFLGNSPQDLMTVPQLQGRSRTSFIGDIFRACRTSPFITIGRGGTRNPQ